MLRITWLGDDSAASEDGEKREPGAADLAQSLLRLDEHDRGDLTDPGDEALPDDDVDQRGFNGPQIPPALNNDVSDEPWADDLAA